MTRDLSSDARLRQRTDEKSRVIHQHADIVEREPPRLSEPLGDAVLENLAAEEADAGTCGRLRREMLAAAKPDLDPDILDRPREERARVEDPLLRRRETEARQQILDELLLPRAQAPPAPPAVKRLLPAWRRPDRTLGHTPR